MYCSNCNSLIPDGSKFCADCGTSVSPSIQCSACNHDTPANSQYCASCGEAIKTEKTFTGSVDSSSLIIKKITLESLPNQAQTLSKVPYGFFALITVNGQVIEIIQEGDALEKERSNFSTFIADIQKAISKFLGKDKAEPEIYLVADLNLLPVASVERDFMIPGIGDLKLSFRFVFNRSNENLSKLIGLFMQGRVEMSVSEYVALCSEKLDLIAPTLDPTLVTGSAGWNESMQMKFLQISGLDLLIVNKSNSKGVVKTIDIGQQADVVVCIDCGEKYGRISKFCESCGSANLRLESSNTSIKDADGKQIIARIGYRAISDVDEGQLASSLFQQLAKVLESLSSDQFSNVSQIRAIESSLNATVASELKYTVSDLRVLDLKEESKDWAFKTGDLLEKEMRNAEFLKRRMILTTEAEEEYQSAIFELSLQKRERILAEYGATLDDAYAKSVLDNEFYQKQTSLDEIKKETDFELEKKDLTRSADLTKIKEGLTDESLELTRKRELDETIHKSKIIEEELKSELSSRAMLHNAALEEERSLKQAALETQRASQELEESQLQNAHSRSEQQLENESQREIRKLESMAELERLMAQQDSKSEIDRISAMKDMTPEAILALQATEISKQASPDSVAQVVENISRNGKTEELYERLLAEKQLSKDELKQALNESNDALLKSNASLADAFSKTAESRLDGYKEAAQAAKATNEKSMDSMAKVAASAAQRKEPNVVVATPCKNESCNHKFEGKVGKFCPICGTGQ